MIEYAAILFVLVPLFIYSVLISIECGASLFAWKPLLLGSKIDPNSYIHPAWEATNVFLVFAIIAFIAFFPGALIIWGTQLILPILVFLVVMGARTLGMLLFFYSDKRNAFVSYLLLVPSMLAPGVLVGGILFFFISGSTHVTWESSLAGLAAIVIMLILSISFFTYIHLRSKASLARFISFVVLFGIVFFAIAFQILPTIVYPNVTLWNSFTDVSSAIMLFWVFSIGSIIVFPALWLMYTVALSDPHTGKLTRNA